ncbi:MAG: bifunctional diaminohydroxyphosphoribosylaminopyrimidine deaminase/5-amino-6-(5-phosphoribosylamino)uracil reductase RibD [Saprospiraceae bacterium]|nr:bifunctional diaminohydroxyphosphoribosylaminopyrimidine deaminase/5-amino-6-(5-phosphoribosylamino)uracil reductase RibD [Saprospiraceae bacterium]
MHFPFMRRCFDLARLGAGRVSPNPQVGAVLVHERRIIGEGWHRAYGQAHAEVNAVRSVRPEDRRFLPDATLYCSLEPCFHHGKTPPCVDLILHERIRRVVIANTDPNPLVAGQSVAKLRAAGVEVITGVLENEGKWLNRVFFKWIQHRQPYIILKWAQSSDGFLGKNGERTPISGPAALRMGHRWRAETDAILVGTTTARVDNPRLDNRFWPGPTPLRIAFDRNSRIPADYHLLDDAQSTWILGPERKGNWQHTRFIDTGLHDGISDLIGALSSENRTSLLVEGGAETLQRFIALGFWDEIRVLESNRRLTEGVRAPVLPDNAFLTEQAGLGDDTLSVFAHS